MNIEQAKLIPLGLILEKMGLKPTKQKLTEQWFLSPFRNENTGSFHVNVKNNIWYDHGEGVGGDGIALVSHYLKANSHGHTVSDALRWLKNMTGHIPFIAPVQSVDYSLLDKKLVLQGKKKIEHPALIQYLNKRGIPLKVGSRYLDQIQVLNKETKKSFFALGMQNEDGGHEFRNLYFKGCVSPKTITFIRGTIPKPPGINIIEGMFDFLSIITLNDGKPLENDTIILHSLSCLKTASAYMHNYGYATGMTWLDNDNAGKKATNALADFFKTQEFMEHRPMNSLYASHKDVNAWHMKRLGL